MMMLLKKINCLRLLTNFSVLLLIIVVFSCSKDDEATHTEEETNMLGIGDVRDISAFDLVAEMGVGWNLGNTLDVTAIDKTYWGNPITTKAMIDEVSNMGFKTLRIPVTWGPNQSDVPPYTIDKDYLNEVKRIVDYGFENKMHVIINVHHDDDWAIPNASEAEGAKQRLGRLWTQIASRFIKYNDSLIFETLNEPREIGIPEEWIGGTSAGRSYVNEFNEVAVNAIRETGGNNEKRHIMIPTWAATSLQVAMDDLIIPNNDPKIIISQHVYYPWQFAGQGSAPWGSDQDKLDLEAEFDRIKQKWIVEKNHPVIIGEWGTIDLSTDADRLDYVDFYVKEASKRGFPTIVWDNGADFPNGDSNFGLLNRNNLTWYHEDIAIAIVNASN